MLEKEFEYYRKHQDELVREYSGKYVVIRSEEVVGVYADFDEAVREASKKYDLGTFLVQKCEPGAASYTQTFHSRVSFG